MSQMSCNMYHMSNTAGPRDHVGGQTIRKIKCELVAEIKSKTLLKSVVKNAKTMLCKLFGRCEVCQFV